MKRERNQYNLINDKYYPYLPFQHAVLLKRLIVIDVCVAGYQWTFGIKCPSLYKSGIGSGTIQPTYSTTAAVLKML